MIHPGAQAVIVLSSLSCQRLWRLDRAGALHLPSGRRVPEPHRSSSTRSKILNQKDASKIPWTAGQAKLPGKPQAQSFPVLSEDRIASRLPGHASGPDPLSGLPTPPAHGQGLRVPLQEAAPTWRPCWNLPFRGVPRSVHGAPLVRVSVRSGGTLWPVRRGQSRMCHPHF